MKFNEIRRNGPFCKRLRCSGLFFFQSTEKVAMRSYLLRSSLRAALPALLWCSFMRRRRHVFLPLPTSPAARLLAGAFFLWDVFFSGSLWRRFLFLFFLAELPALQNPKPLQEPQLGLKKPQPEHWPHWPHLLRAYPLQMACLS